MDYSHITGLIILNDLNPPGLSAMIGQHYIVDRLEIKHNKHASTIKKTLKIVYSNYSSGSNLSSMQIIFLSHNSGNSSSVGNCLIHIMLHIEMEDSTHGQISCKAKK